MCAGTGLMALGALVALLTAPAAALQCLRRNSVIGTFPAGDIAVRYGEALKIYCCVEPPYNSSQLSFVRRVANNSLKKYDSKIVNATTACLDVPLPERQSSTYDCELKAEDKETMCTNKVVVDSTPESVNDFKCRSYNLEQLVCTWRPPVHYIKTEYFLSYYFLGDISFPCEVIYEHNHYVSKLGLSSPTVYRNSQLYYNFNLTAKNVFGSITQNITVDHFAVLIPKDPYNLMLKLTSHSVELQWQISFEIATFPPFKPPVDHKIKYQIKTVDNLDKWRLADITLVERYNSTCYKYLLKDLPYAHWQYDIRVYIKSVKAPDEDEFWKFQAATFITPSDRPPRPPRTEVGAFQSKKLLTSERDVYVHWQQLEEYEESGDNFTYYMVATDGKNRYVQYNSSGYAHFKASLRAYNVTITSVNNEGSSVENSSIYIPAHSDILREPTSFTKTVLGNKTYDLRWHSPYNENIDSYTLFWCFHTDSEQSAHCTGKLNFTKLNRTTNSQRISVAEDGKTYQFAISANRGVMSSGMVWATCSLPVRGATNRVAKFSRVDVGSRHVELQWDLGCAFSEGYVKGYNITYCQVANNSTLCTDTEEHSYPIEDPNQKDVNITGLVPHTTYNFHISVIYNDSVGLPSNSVGATTNEGKPSQPLNMQISQVTNQSLIVSWDPPAVKNGLIKHYMIKYCIDDSQICPENITNPPERLGKDERQEITLKNLQPFSNYTVYVKACTTACSEYAEAGMLRTAIGVPNLIETARLNASSIQWEPPDNPGGTLDFYQIQISEGDAAGRVISLFNSSSQKMEHDVEDCKNLIYDKSNLLYRVRAVNLDLDNDHGAKIFRGNVTLAEMPKGSGTHLGPWSNPVWQNCSKSHDTLFWSLGIVMMIVFVIMTALGSRKIWIRLKTMTDIETELPPGLGPTEEKDSGNPLGGAWSPPSKGNDERVFPHIAGDEVLLLPPPPPRRTAHSGSSDSTDSTTLSLTSKGLGERDGAPCDDTSDDSSLHLQLRAAPADPAPPPSTITSGGYKAWANRPATPVYDDDDADSTGSEDLSDPALPSGYVQPAALPLPMLRPPSLASHPNPTTSIPSGYVRAQDANVGAQFSPRLSSLGPASKLIAPGDQQPPKFLPMEWKVPPLQSVTTAVGKPTEAASTPADGYVSHADAVLNKHVSIVSGSHLGEEPALLDPNMSQEGYCRFGWNSDPTADNLDSLLSEGPSPAAQSHIFADHSPK